MRIKLMFDSNNLICLPYKYNVFLRNLIYQLLPSEFASFLHDIGYKYEKRSFKLFTFSRIIGKRIKDKRNRKYPLVFNKRIYVYVASPINKILEYVASSALTNEEIMLGDNRCFLRSIEVEKSPEFSERVKIKMLSPMSIRSTFFTHNNTQKSYYYSPFEREFSELMKRNMVKKYKIVYGEKMNGDLKIKPLGRVRERIVIGDRGFVIKAWDGIYELQGSPELIKLSYSTGLGEKNSLGLGMWERWEGQLEV